MENYIKLKQLTGVGVISNLGRIKVVKYENGKAIIDTITENVFWKSCNDYKDYYILEIRPYGEAKTFDLSQSIQVDVKLEITIINEEEAK